MRIGIVSQFYAPEPGPARLPSALAEELARRGHQIRVVTGFPNYPTGTLAPGYRLARRAEEEINGARVRRVYLHPDHGSPLGRTLNYGSFAASAMASGVRWLRHADAVWVNASPITLAGPVWMLRAMRVPVVSHILDLWPESLYASGFRHLEELSIARTALDRWSRALYRGSDRVAYISAGVGALLTSRGVPANRIAYVPMWADEAVFRPGGTSLRAELGLHKNTTVLVYAGSLGEAQGLETLIRACALVERPDFMCLIVGSGSAEESLRRQAGQLRNVRFLGRMPHDRMADLLATADASFVSLRDTPLGRVSTPSKTQAALSAGTPVLAAARGDVCEIVSRFGVGLTADPRDPVDVARALTQLTTMSPQERSAMRRRAFTTYEAEFSLARGAHRIEELLAAATMQRHGTERS